MADIKTRDAVKGTIKTIDKAAVASERMKSAYSKIKNKAITLRKAPLPNMPPIEFRQLQSVLQMRAFISSISKVKRRSKPQRIISLRQRIK